MAELIIIMNLDNAEFDDDYKRAVERKLRGVMTDIDFDFKNGIIMDANGNRVGQWLIK